MFRACILFSLLGTSSFVGGTQVGEFAYEQLLHFLNSSYSERVTCDSGQIFASYCTFERFYFLTLLSDFLFFIFQSISSPAFVFHISPLVSFLSNSFSSFVLFYSGISFPLFFSSHPFLSLSCLPKLF